MARPSVALQVADLLDISVVDQAHVMRKLVIDGSNTSGFQRSILLGQAGEIETSEGRVSIADLMLEEESAKRVEETEEGVVYSLDRLGVPLVEIETGPDIRSPEGARGRPSASACCSGRRARSSADSARSGRT